MKRIFGLSLIIVFGAINLLLLTISLYILIGDTQENTTENTISYIFVMTLFSFPIIYGLRLWTQGKKVDNLEIDEYRFATVKFESKIQQAEYSKLVFTLQYRNLTILFATVIGLNLMLSTFLAEEASLYATVFGASMCLLPLLISLMIKRYYNKFTNYHETLQCEINVDTITIKGETFSTTERWTNIQKMIELRNWFVIYANSFMPRFFLSKENMTSQDVERIRYFISVRRA